MEALTRPVECVACYSPAIIKDYREHNTITDGYPACYKHLNFDDRNFWKAVYKKEREAAKC